MAKASKELSPISEFYRGKTIFITGATGFLGKILIEKLLRSCPDVKTIYVLIRSKYGRSVKERLQDMFVAKVFDLVREEQPKQFYKVVALEGDVNEEKFGLKESEINMLYDEVTIVFHSAASVKFNEPLRNAVVSNLLATKYVIEACNNMKNLEALIHVSTAYCNVDREVIDEVVYDMPLDIDYLLETVKLSDDSTLEALTPRLLNRQHNTYTFTKALAESLLQRECKNFPVAIVRPAIVVSTWKEPFPGWICSATGTTPLVIGISRGIFKTLLCEPDVAVEFVPSDIVINMMLTVGWKTAVDRPNQLEVYNCTSSWANKTTLREILDYCLKYSVQYPSPNIVRYPKCTLDNKRMVYIAKTLLYHYFPACILDMMVIFSGKKPRYINNMNIIHKALRTQDVIGTREWTFRTGNVVALMKCMTDGDKQIFGFDMTDLDWQEYFHNHFFGIQKYILKESADTTKSLQRLYFKEQVLNLSAVVVGSLIICKFAGWLLDLSMRFF